ncbi:MAG: hypothetical protein WCO57_03675 [Verrucomicrobiota bacterium]
MPQILALTIKTFVVGTLLGILTAPLHAWEPTAIYLDAAIKSGDFAGYLSNAGAWLGEKAPGGEPEKIIEAARGELFKDALFTNTLDQRQLIAKCGVDKLGTFAKAEPANQTFLAWLLKNTQAMNLYLEGGVPLDKDYIGSLGVLRSIIAADPDARQGLCLRLALATSLAHAKPYKAFEAGEVIDPVKRYQHFKQAHKDKDLAPMFDDLSVWELVKVVDSVASDSDLAWARAMLKTLRPELVREARYIAMVSEVQYTSANWGPPPHTFATVLNGGGKCGPRAWFGRMINQAFGVPVWGVKQPGHAAVGFLGNEGWKVKLGRGWDKSTWDHMHGNQFLEIVKARDQARDFSQAAHLRWLADTAKSKDQAAALTQAAELIEKNPLGPTTVHKLTHRDYPPPQAEPPWQAVAGVQHLVAVEWSKASKASRLPSFDFGKQVYFQKNEEQWVEYMVSIPKAETYGITIGHAVANGNCRVRVYVGDNKIGWMSLNNTKGLWGKTREVDFQLPQTDTVRFVFPAQRGVAVKWFELRAKGNAPPTVTDAEPESKSKAEAPPSSVAPEPE